jgi:hypothetical protein
VRKTDTGSPAKLAADRHYAREAAVNASRARWVGDLYAFIMDSDPRNCSALYDRMADDFFRETGLMAPGKSVPAEMMYSGEQEIPSFALHISDNRNEGTAMRRR